MDRQQDPKRHKRAAQKRALRRFLLGRLESEARSFMRREIYALCQCGSEDSVRGLFLRGLVNEVLERLVESGKVRLEDDAYRAVTADVSDDAVLPSADDIAALPDADGAPSLFDRADEGEHAPKESGGSRKRRMPRRALGRASLEGLIMMQLVREGPATTVELHAALSQREGLHELEFAQVRNEIARMRDGGVIRRLEGEGRGGKWRLSFAAPVPSAPVRSPEIGPSPDPGASFAADPFTELPPAVPEGASHASFSTDEETGMNADVPVGSAAEVPVPADAIGSSVPADPPAPIEPSPGASANAEAPETASTRAATASAKARQTRRPRLRKAKVRKSAQSRLIERRTRTSPVGGRTVAPRINTKPARLRSLERLSDAARDRLRREILAAIEGFCRDVSQVLLAWLVEVINDAFARSCP